jgi:hypothetical protein
MAYAKRVQVCDVASVVVWDFILRKKLCIVTYVVFFFFTGFSFIELRYIAYFKTFYTVTFTQDAKQYAYVYQQFSFTFSLHNV